MSKFRSRGWLDIDVRFKRAFRLVFATIASASSARTSVKFIIAMLAVLLPCSVVLYQTVLRATSNFITVNTLSDSSTPFDGFITVNTLNDSSKSGDGFCSLREAINNADAASDTTSGDCGSGGSVATFIDFNVSGKITLTSTLPPIDPITNTLPGSLTINGTGPTGQITLDGANSSSVLVVNSGATLNLSFMTIANGTSGSNVDESGGGIENFGTLTVTSSAFVGNSAVHEGGGIANFGDMLMVTNSTFANNSADFGGGIENFGGTVTVTNCTFSGNSALFEGVGFGGGGIDNEEGSVTVNDSTFVDNLASNGSGGGIANLGDTLTVNTSTFSGNSAADGGGIFASNTSTSDETTSVISSTFSSNSASNSGGAVENAGGPLTISDSILANSTSGLNCSGTISANSLNISDDKSCGFGSSNKAANGLLVGDSINPLLDPNGLQDNGGPTQTIALQSTSPAVDAIPNEGSEGCPGLDQRGDPRPDAEDVPGGACDIGAFEFGPTPTATATPTATPTLTPTATATQTPGPMIALDMRGIQGLDFGQVPVNSSTTLQFGVTNMGGGEATGPITTQPPFSIPDNPNLMVTDSQTVTVKFLPTSANPFVGFQVTVQCDDCGGQEPLFVALSGAGTVAATPTSTASATPTQTATRTATVTATPTLTPTTTASATPTQTVSPTVTATATSTSATSTATPTATSTMVASQTATGSATPAATSTSTATASPVLTATPTATATQTSAPIATPTPTPTIAPVDGMLKITPATLNLGTVLSGGSRTKAVTVRNAGKHTKKVQSPAIAIESASASASSPFMVSQNGCPAMLAAGAHCTINVTFTPGTAIASGTTMLFKGTLTIEDNVNDDLQPMIALTGTGKMPKIKK